MFVFGMIGNTDVEILNPEEVIIKKWRKNCGLNICSSFIRVTLDN
jgi:hypothetical protein